MVRVPAGGGWADAWSSHQDRAVFLRACARARRCSPAPGSKTSRSCHCRRLRSAGRVVAACRRPHAGPEGVLGAQTSVRRDLPPIRHRWAACCQCWALVGQHRTALVSSLGGLNATCSDGSGRLNASEFAVLARDLIQAGQEPARNAELRCRCLCPQQHALRDTHACVPALPVHCTERPRTASRTTLCSDALAKPFA